MHTNFVQWLTMFPNCYHVNLIGNKSQWLIVERLVPFLWHICCDHLHLAVRKKKPLALWIYGRISVFYFHSIKPVRIEFRNVTICFFFGNPKWIWWRKSTTQCTEVFTDLLNFWFERWVSIVYLFFLEFTHMQTLSWHIFKITKSWKQGYIH